MGFADFYFDSLINEEKTKIDKENEEEIEVDDESPDDEYALYTDPDEEFEFPEEEKEMNEKLVKKMVIRGGVKKKKWTSDKEGYRIELDPDTKRPKEVRMDAAEKRLRKLSQRKAAKKRKAGKAQAQVKRKISLRKRALFSKKK